MRIKKLKGYENWFTVNIIHSIEIDMFAKALGGHFYSKSMPFDTAITKKQAMDVLRTHLYFHGKGSAHEGLDDLGDQQEEYEEAIKAAKEWVEATYPELVNK